MPCTAPSQWWPLKLNVDIDWTWWTRWSTGLSYPWQHYHLTSILSKYLLSFSLPASPCLCWLCILCVGKTWQTISRPHLWYLWPLSIMKLVDVDVSKSENFSHGLKWYIFEGAVWEIKIGLWFWDTAILVLLSEQKFVPIDFGEYHNPYHPS